MGKAKSIVQMCGHLMDYQFGAFLQIAQGVQERIVSVAPGGIITETHYTDGNGKKYQHHYRFVGDILRNGALSGVELALVD